MVWKKKMVCKTHHIKTENGNKCKASRVFLLALHFSAFTDTLPEAIAESPRL